MTNIYFAGSIRGGVQDAPIYQKLIKHLNTYGTVLTEHVGDAEKTMQMTWSDSQIWVQDMKWLHESQFLVAEVTVTSLGVGYELGIAESLQIPVLCLFRGTLDQCSAMITGNDRFTVVCYTAIEEAIFAIDAFAKKVLQDK